MSKAVVAAVAVAFAVMLAVIFFLLGRESKHAAVATAPAATAVAPVVEATGVPHAAPPMTGDPWASAPPQPVPQPPSPVTNPTPTTTPNPAPRASNAAAIRDYFIRMQSIQAVGLTGDSNDVADQLLAGAMKGDSSGLDQVVKSLSDGIDKTRSIQPPPECAGYHQNMIALLSDSIGLVRSLEGALQSGDPSSIASLAMTGNSLKSRTDALEAEGKAIRARAGL